MDHHILSIPRYTQLSIFPFGIQIKHHILHIGVQRRNMGPFSNVKGLCYVFGETILKQEHGRYQNGFVGG